MSKLRTVIGIEGSEKTWLVMVPEGSTVGDFLTLVKARQKNQDFAHVWFDGSELFEDDEFKDYWSADGIFFVTVSDTAPSAEIWAILRRSRSSIAKPPAPAPSVSAPQPVITPTRPIVVSLPTPSQTPVQPPTLDRLLQSLAAYRSSTSTSTTKFVVRDFPALPAIDASHVRVFTTMSFASMVTGHDLIISLTSTREQVATAVASLVHDSNSPQNYQLSLYLPGGIPFKTGTLSDVFTNASFRRAPHILYVVVTRPISADVLSTKYSELCNCNTNDRKLLLSPICESTEVGLTHIASLLGYLNREGTDCTNLLKSLAQLTGFAPMLCALRRLILRKRLHGVEIAAITTCLQSIILGYVNTTANRAFEFVLRTCCFLVEAFQGNLDADLPFVDFQVDSTKTDTLTQYLTGRGYGKCVRIWQADLGTVFSRYSIDRPPNEAIGQIFDRSNRFRPVAPLDLRTATSLKIAKVKGNRTALYHPVANKADDGTRSDADLIDPVLGRSVARSLDELAEEVGSGNVSEMVNPDTVTQLIQVCFDESGSMGGDIHGNEVNGGEYHRVTIAAQYLTTFANRMYAFRVPCLQSLMTFGHLIRVRSRFSPLVPDFEGGIKAVVPCGQTRLWDALSKAADDLETVNQSGKTKKFPNAKLRILVISDGEDTASNAAPHQIAMRLINAGIVVDSVVINSNDTCKSLCALCQMTGGLSFRPQTVKDGLALFEEEAFLFIEKRAPKQPYRGAITKTTIETLAGQAVFDSHIENADLQIAKSIAGLVSPRHVVFHRMGTDIQDTREKRLVRELKFAAAVQDPAYRAIDDKGDEVSYYDDEIVIYPFEDSIDKWRIFILGPKGTPYAGKWWYVLATFPVGYPIDPPVFRFVSVPYHLNVSSEGRICLHDLERGYGPNSNVVELIQTIKQVFLIPEEGTPVELTKWFQFKHNRAEYDRLAAESCRTRAKDRPDEFLTGIAIKNQVPAGFKLEAEVIVPAWKRSAFTGMPIPLDKQVMASSGILYHIDELRQHLASTANPICVVTGKELTERVEDLS
jgi:ubiquitin-protein ligase